MKKIFITIALLFFTAQTVLSSSMTNNSYSFNSPTTRTMKKNIDRLNGISQSYSSDMHQELERFQTQFNQNDYTYDKDNIKNIDAPDTLDEQNPKKKTKKQPKDTTPKWFRQESNPYEWKLD